MTVTVPISTLVLDNSPRQDGEDSRHTQALAEVEGQLPPILVHAPAMRVIDGLHRVRAATLRGETSIPAVIYEGGEADAFVLAVKMNVSHGLPLAHADRMAAAGRILASHTRWSDRRVALATGLSAKTVGELRRRSTEESTQSNARFGRDGRLRPLSSAEGRIKAGQLLAERPASSLREVAREAGVSPSTVHDVRQRLLAGEDVVPARQRRRPVTTARVTRESSRVRVAPPEDPETALAGLRKDPSLRLSESGRSLLRWLDRHRAATEESARFVEAIPPHCVDIVARLARGYAKVWDDFAKEAEARSIGKSV
ncbi:ParB N-terminal domain-containing protein [Streptomyces daliensis]